MSAQTQSGLTSSRDLAAAFDRHTQEWGDYTTTPLGRLRQELTLYYLRERLAAAGPRLRVLDAGAGTGGYGLGLAHDGHRVCLLDFSWGMLNAAKGRANSADGLSLQFLCAPVEDAASLFEPAFFDAILCHTLLEYVREPWRVLGDLARLLRPGGVLSLLCANTRAEPLRWIWSKGDAAKAREALGQPEGSADLFGLPRRTFCAQELRDALARAGITVEQERGIRCFADFVPRERLSDPAFFAQVRDLELAAASTSDYNVIARYIHILGTAAGHPPV